MRPRAARSEAGSQNYFISFTDLLVGMLFIFIVLLMTYAVTYQRAKKGLHDRIDELERRVVQRRDLLTRLQTNLRRRHVEATADPDQGVLRLAEHVLFKPGQANLDAKAQQALSVLADELARELPCYSVRYRAASCGGRGAPILEAVYIEGHTDDVPINTRQFPSNWELSSARAIVTYRYLTAGSGVLKELPNASGSAGLLGASAYANTRHLLHPKSSAENRRIDFRFLLAPPTHGEFEKARQR